MNQSTSTPNISSTAAMSNSQLIDLLYDECLTSNIDQMKVLLTNQNVNPRALYNLHMKCFGNYDPNTNNKLFQNTNNNLLHAAALSNNPSVLDYVIDTLGFKDINYTDLHGYTALALAIRKGNILSVKYLLGKYKVSYSQQPKNFHISAYSNIKGSYEDPNLINKSISLLTLACMANDIDLMNYLTSKFQHNIHPELYDIRNSSPQLMLHLVKHFKFNPDTKKADTKKQHRQAINTYIIQHNDINLLQQCLQFVKWPLDDPLQYIDSIVSHSSWNILRYLLNRSDVITKLQQSGAELLPRLKTTAPNDIYQLCWDKIGGILPCLTGFISTQNWSRFLQLMNEYKPDVSNCTYIGSLTLQQVLFQILSSPKCTIPLIQSIDPIMQKLLQSPLRPIKSTDNVQPLSKKQNQQQLQQQQQLSQYPVDLRNLDNYHYVFEDSTTVELLPLALAVKHLSIEMIRYLIQQYPQIIPNNQQDVMSLLECAMARRDIPDLFNELLDRDDIYQHINSAALTTLLFISPKYHNFEISKSLIERYSVDPTTKCSKFKNKNLLEHVMSFKNVNHQLFQYLIKSGQFDVEMEFTDPMGVLSQSLLSLAVASKRFSVDDVRCLVENGANVHIIVNEATLGDGEDEDDPRSKKQNKSGRSQKPSINAKQNKSRKRKIEYNTSDSSDYIFTSDEEMNYYDSDNDYGGDDDDNEYGYDGDDDDDDDYNEYGYGDDDEHEECMKYIIMTSLVNDQPLYFKSCGFKNVTLLLMSYLSGEKDKFNYLVTCGIDFNAQDFHGRTIIHHACQYQDKEAFQVLLPYKNKINPNIIEKAFDYTPLELLFDLSQNYEVEEAFEWFLKFNPEIQLKQCYHTTPLLHAMSSGQNIDLISLLLKSNSDIYARNENDKQFGIMHYVVQTVIKSSASDFDFTEAEHEFHLERYVSNFIDGVIENHPLFSKK